MREYPETIDKYSALLSPLLRVVTAESLCLMAVTADRTADRTLREPSNVMIADDQIDRVFKVPDERTVDEAFMLVAMRLIEQRCDNLPCTFIGPLAWPFSARHELTEKYRLLLGNSVADVRTVVYMVLVLTRDCTLDEFAEVFMPFKDGITKDGIHEVALAEAQYKLLRDAS